MQLITDFIALTALPNRSLLMDRIGQAFKRMQRFPANHLAVMYLDLDRFKTVNDTLGHQVGRKAVAEALLRFGSGWALAAEHDRDDAEVLILGGGHDGGVRGHGPSGLQSIAAGERVQEVVMVEELERLARPA